MRRYYGRMTVDDSRLCYFATLLQIKLTRIPFISSHHYHSIAGAWAYAQCSGFTWVEQRGSGKDERQELELHFGRLFGIETKEEIGFRLVEYFRPSCT